MDEDDPIGEINPIRYRSYYYDDEIGLYYLRARYYDPETGRFISQDNINYLDPEHLSGLNLYAYCNDNPVMYEDPSGHSVILSVLGIIAIITATTALGAASGAVISGVTYAMMEDEFSQEAFWASVAGGAVTGAVTGLAAGITLITGGSAGVIVAVSAVAGAIGGALGSLTENAILGKNLLSKEVLCDVAFSFVVGAAFGALFGATQGASLSVRQIAQQKGRTLAEQLFKTLRYQVVKKSGSKMLENLLGDVTSWIGEIPLEYYFDLLISDID